MAQVDSESSTAAPVDSSGPQFSGLPEGTQEGPLYIPSGQPPKNCPKPSGRFARKPGDEIDLRMKVLQGI
jgi:hypothetical protein